MNSSKKKIIVAMSGGVDSSVAAALLAQEGHEVIGVTLKLLPRGGQGFGCCGSPDDVALAKRSAEKAGIPHYVLDYTGDFDKNVINYFVNSYVAGETPNPCLACNRHIKFDRLKEFAKTLDATHLATGHYARIETIDDASGPVYRLFEAHDSTKDQSYVLYNTNQKGLASTLFPVGTKNKSEIRDVARKIGLPNADKADSQEICFVPNKDYRTFVENKLRETLSDIPATAQPGPIKNSKGEVIGEHRGIAFYTIGQRKGLGITTKVPHFVTALESSTNTIVVGPDTEGLNSGLLANDIQWIRGAAPGKEFRALAKIRYKHEPTPARIFVDGERVQVEFEEPQRAVTPGQAVVFYKYDALIGAREVVGGGKISQSLRA